MLPAFPFLGLCVGHGAMGVPNLETGTEGWQPASPRTEGNGGNWFLSALFCQGQTTFCRSVIGEEGAPFQRIYRQKGPG